MTFTAISVIGMDIYAVEGTSVSQCRLQCCQMAITIYRRLMKLFPPIWQHHRLMIVSTIVSIPHGQMPLIPPLGHGTTNPKLDAFLLQCTLRSSDVLDNCGSLELMLASLQWARDPPPIKPEIMLPIIPRSKVGDDLPTARAPRAAKPPHRRRAA
jgi:hypothetical protein